jgi:hypothetical protein
MSLTEDLIIRMRAAGARNAARDVDATTKAVGRAGKTSRKTAKDTSLLGKSTGLLLKPFHHLRDEAFGLAKGVAAAGLAFGSVEGIKRSIETTDSLVKTTVRLRSQFGLTTEAASGLGGVLQARGLDTSGLQIGLGALSRQLVYAEHGSRRAQGAFRILGINARGVHTALNRRDGLAQTFETVVDQLTKMHGGARKAALGQQLLGQASRGLAPLLQEGALGLKQQLKWAKEYGVTLDGKTVGSVEDMAAAQTKAQYAMLGLQIQIGRFAAPLVTKANVTLAEIVKSFRDGRPEGNQFARTVYQLGQDLKPVGHDLLVVGRYLKDHPRLLQAAAVAYGAYRLKLLKLITLAPAAYLKGLIAGRAFRTGYETGAGSTPVWRTAGSRLGRTFGTAMGLAATVAIGLEIGNWLNKHGVPQWLAKKITGIDPKKTAAQNRRTSRLERGDAGAIARSGATITYPDPAHGFRPVTVQGHVPKLILDAHVHTHIDGKEVAKSTHRVAVKRKATR